VHECDLLRVERAELREVLVAAKDVPRVDEQPAPVPPDAVAQLDRVA
jgi:hypothetical protein